MSIDLEIDAYDVDYKGHTLEHILDSLLENLNLKVNPTGYSWKRDLLIDKDDEDDEEEE